MIITIAIIVFACIEISKKPFGENAELINKETFLNVVGFSAYLYEGVGIIIPVRNVTANKE